MSVFSALYQLLIGPLELFFEILFAVADRILQDPGLSIVFLSLAMNFLVLPLYRRADAMQEQERQTELRLRPGVTHIKKTFTGDERFMILQTFYRENGYRPTDALRGSVSLLLEVPFFIAAYNFLSGLQLLHGTSFGPIADLGVPDSLLTVGGVTVHVLPVLMTAINLVSGAIYTKGASMRSKLQLYGMALLFLVLLYDSPSGLVFYWTLNNLFSLGKNIVYKLLPARKKAPKQIEPATKKDRQIFLAGSVFLAVLTGLMIPAAVIHASPEEFLSPVTRLSPLLYILHAALTAAGLFLVWVQIFYALAGDRGKKAMAGGICVMCGAALLDYLFYGRDYGNLSADLVFDLEPRFLPVLQLTNLLGIAALAGLVRLVWRRRRELMRTVLVTAALAGVVLSAVQMTGIQSVAARKLDQLEQSGADLPVIPLSRDGRNVVVLMMDRGISAYVPFLLEEKPQLRDQFAGFTYYPNTLSFGAHTNFGSPALFGGYDYTPERINERSSESLEQKQNEALKVMPVLFSEAGFETTVFDPPCAGYDWIPDVSIYDDYPAIRAMNSMGKLDLDPEGAARRTDAKRSRNFFCYSLFRTAPVCLQGILYAGGSYNALQTVEDADPMEGVRPAFLRAYSVLENLSAITDIRSGAENTFLMMTNDTTHEPTFLQVPDYVPASGVTDGPRTPRTLDGVTLKMEEDRQIQHYEINMAAFLKLGTWFDWLRSQEVFDNTRIIIVSDHGSALGSQVEGRRFGPGWDDDVMFYNPLLLVKDFGSTEWSVDERFMTNADTPVLAMDGLIPSPVNPFTGVPIDASRKAGPQLVCCSHEYDIGVNNGNTFLPGPWYRVQDNVFDTASWVFAGEH